MESIRPTEGVPVFHEVRAPTAGELQALLSRIIKRIMRLLRGDGGPGKGHGHGKGKHGGD